MIIIKQKWGGGAQWVCEVLFPVNRSDCSGDQFQFSTHAENTAVILACLDNDDVGGDHTCRGWEGVELSKHCLLFTITHFYSQATD